MATLSKLHDKCEKCKHKGNCNNKRMVACALAETPKYKNDTAAPIAETFAQPIARKHTPITINMGEYGKIETSLEGLQEQFKRGLEKELYKGVFRCGT